MPLASKNLLEARQEYRKFSAPVFEETLVGNYIEALECELEAYGVKLELPLEPEDNRPYVTLGMLPHGFYAEKREYVQGEYRVTGSMHLKVNNKVDAAEAAMAYAKGLGWEYR